MLCNDCKKECDKFPKVTECKASGDSCEAYKPIIFAFHGYPSLIDRLTYRRKGHDNIHVRGYKEEGTTTTPFDMWVLNDLDRFHLVSHVIDRVPKLGSRAAYAKQATRDKLIEHKAYICRHGEDMPEVAR
jgi:xylulose-5-phosphate/fructose-6-phosphate phosphoketolase